MTLPNILSAPSLQFHNKILYIIPVIPQIFLPVWLCSHKSLGPQNSHTDHHYLLKCHQSFNIYVRCYFTQDILIRCHHLSYSALQYVDACLIPTIQSFLRPTTVSYFIFTLTHLQHVVTGQYISAKLKWLWKENHGVEKYLPCWTYDNESRVWDNVSKIWVWSELCLL